MIDNILQVRNGLVNFHVLKDERKLYLIDTGFINGKSNLKQALKNRGWDKYPLIGIVITHGHLDHILNAYDLAKQYGAWIAAPSLDAHCYAGKSQSKGLIHLNDLTRIAESFGRRVLNFKPFTPDLDLKEGDKVDIWNGLEVIGLPGHTRGHIGLYYREERLLFSADLFASFKRISHLPPMFLNEN